MTFTRTEHSPFDRSEVLAEDYIPDKVLGRNKELTEIEEVMQQIVDREQPVNAFIYGISGTGKTVSVKYKIDQLETALDQYNDVHAEFVYQNCESLTSSYQTAIAIANTYLTDERYDYLHKHLNLNRRTLPNSGLPKERVYDILFTIFDLLTYRHTEYRQQIEQAVTAWDGAPTDLDTDAIVDGDADDTVLETVHDSFDIQPPDAVRDYVMVILDEVDRIGTRDELLYEIPRCRINNRVENVHPSVIGVSNDIGYKEAIQSKTDSSLRLKEITFTKYTAEQLQEILTQRAAAAFKDDAYETGILPLAAAYARQQGGDARYGIDLLQKAGIKAKQAESKVVTEEFVREARDEKERDRIREVTLDLSDHEKVVLGSVMYHQLRGETPVPRVIDNKDATSSDEIYLYRTYRRFASEVLDKANKHRRVADYLKKLSQLGLLNRKNAYDGPGEAGFEYSLGRADYNLIFQVLSDDDNSVTDDSLVPTELLQTFEAAGTTETGTTQSESDSFT
jgi:cell division control protein 6